MSSVATNPSSPSFTSKDLVTDQDVRWCPGCGDGGRIGAADPLATFAAPPASSPGTAGGFALASASARQRQGADKEKAPESFDSGASNLQNFGRRDWIRTNDPHHVKVVL